MAECGSQPDGWRAVCGVVVGGRGAMEIKTEGLGPVGQADEMYEQCYTVLASRAES